MNSRIKGDCGEDAAVRYLLKRRYKIIDRNFKRATGEIDIVALDRNTLVFVEVKSRASEKFGAPSEAVDFKKQYKIAKTAQYFVHEKQVYALNKRFDVIEIVGENLRHIKNAFETDLL